VGKPFFRAGIRLRFGGPHLAGGAVPIVKVIGGRDIGARLAAAGARCSAAAVDHATTAVDHTAGRRTAPSARSARARGATRDRTCTARERRRRAPGAASAGARLRDAGAQIRADRLWATAADEAEREHGGAEGQGGEGSAWKKPRRRRGRFAHDSWSGLGNREAAKLVGDRRRAEAAFAAFPRGTARRR